MEGHLVPKDVNLPAERMQSRQGLGKIDAEDRMIPRLKLMQPLSPEVGEGLAKSGEFLNSIAKKSYGKEIEFIPIVWWKSRIYWAQRSEGGEILCQSRDALHGSAYGLCADCDYCKWHDKEAPVCTAIINILMLVNGAELIACSFMKTSYTTGKQLINLFNYKNVDIFNFLYTLYTEQEENAKGKFWVVKYKDLNTAIPDVVYSKCKDLYANFSNLREKVQDINPSEEQ